MPETFKNIVFSPFWPSVHTMQIELFDNAMAFWQLKTPVLSFSSSELLENNDLSVVDGFVAVKLRR